MPRLDYHLLAECFDAKLERVYTSPIQSGYSFIILYFDNGKRIRFDAKLQDAMFPLAVIKMSVGTWEMIEAAIESKTNEQVEDEKENKNDYK